MWKETNMKKEGKMLSEKLSLYSKAAKLSLENAEQWIEDAKLLMEHSSFGHVSALLRFALEETAKAYICWFTSEGIWPLENKPIKDAFQYHRVKNQLILGLLYGVIWLSKWDFSLKRAIEEMPEPSDEEILEAYEEFEEMITGAEKMRQRAIYVDVNLEKKKVAAPPNIEEKEPDNLLKLAEYFVRIVRLYMEKFPEKDKAKLREIFATVPKEAWKAGEIPIEWFREG